MCEIVTLFPVPRHMAGDWHSSRLRLPSMTDFGSPFPTGQITSSAGKSPQNPMTAALFCGGIPCLLSPPPRGTFVANELGIPTDIPQHTSYIASWIKPLKDDKREIFRAAADAQRIASMELSFHHDYAAQVQEELSAVPG